MLAAISVGDPTVLYTLIFIALIGVLILGAHQLDEAGHKRAALALMCAGLMGLVAAVFGPGGTLALLFLTAMYGIFIGLPILAAVMLYRRIRRRAL